MKSYLHFTFSERVCLSNLIGLGYSIRKIAKYLDRSPSSISREIKRNYSKKKKRYHPWRATTLYKQRRKNCRKHYKLYSSPQLFNLVNEYIHYYWSPEIISKKCEEKGFNIAFSTIYRSIRAGLIDKVTAPKYLRRHNKKRVIRNKCATIKPEFTIHDRPSIVEEKTRLGDFEGDTVFGAIGKGCIVTLVDRVSKYVLIERCENKAQETIEQAFYKAFQRLPKQIPLESITLDNGSEFAKFKEIQTTLKKNIYFADPHSPWQRGLNENTNDLIRFFFPKGINFLMVSNEKIQEVETLLNTRPRKTLNYLTPLEFISKKCCT